MSYIYMGQTPDAAAAAPVVVVAKPPEKEGLMRFAFPAGVFASGLVVGWFAGCRSGK